MRGRGGCAELCGVIPVKVFFGKARVGCEMVLFVLLIVIVFLLRGHVPGSQEERGLEI